DSILGFIGLKDNFIQMLFVEPSAMRKGIGKTLLCFAITKHGANTVDVNEQNTNARLFYSKMGFILKERSKSDALGKPYPVLSLVLSDTIC
ncbi:MAG: GNAT family N-acetyltransferase, partial [Pedobacter sp.]